MRKHIRDQIVELLPTVWEGIKYVKKAQPAQAAVVLEDCLHAVASISASLKAGLTEQRFQQYEIIMSSLRDVLTAMHHNRFGENGISEHAKRCKSLLGLLKKELSEEREVKLEVVFMPYKLSMWDSLESIWRAANDDDRCNATVVPIPYYDRNPDRTLGKLHYEGNEYPEDIPVVHYERYDVSAHQPDIIYIHNPYDDSNTVTSIDPRYYSFNLKKYTNMLVYVPYFISGAYIDHQAFAHKHLMSCVRWVDKIVVQSHTHKKLYAACGVNEGKLLVQGSPKLDAVINMNEQRVKVPDSWTEKLRGRKSIVLNSSIGNMLNVPDYLKKMRERISDILSFEELVLIWRPHPLLETTINTLLPQLHDDYMQLIEIVEKSGNAILDLSSSNVAATAVSDGMISDTSSWARQYIATGKPVLMMKGSTKYKHDRFYICDHFSSYFAEDGFSVKDFCSMVINGVDERKKQRVEDFKRSIANSDGTSGIKIHNHIKRLLGT